MMMMMMMIVVSMRRACFAFLAAQFIGSDCGISLCCVVDPALDTPAHSSQRQPENQKINTLRWYIVDVSTIPPIPKVAEHRKTNTSQKGPPPKKICYKLK